MSNKLMNIAFKNSKGTYTDLLVLLCIANYIYEGKDTCFPSITTICKDTRLSRRQVLYSIKKLENLGEIEIDHAGGGRKSNVYKFKLSTEVDFEISNHQESEWIREDYDNTTVAQDNRPSIAFSAPLCSTECTLISNIINNVKKEENKPPIIPQGGSCNSEELFLFYENENEEVTEKEKPKPTKKLPSELEELRLRVCKWFGRKPTTSWKDREIKGLRDFMRESTPEEKQIIEDFYAEKLDEKYLRQAPIQLFNNWPGEVDKANRWSSKPTSNQKPQPKAPEKTIITGTVLDEEYWRDKDGKITPQLGCHNLPNGDQWKRREPEHYLRKGKITKEQFDFYAAKYPERIGTGHWSPENIALAAENEEHRRLVAEEEKRKSEQKNDQKS